MSTKKISKFYVDSKNVSKKFLHRPPYFFSDFFLWSPKVGFEKKIEGTVEELFAYIFGIYIKLGYKNISTLTLSDSIDVAT